MQATQYGRLVHESREQPSDDAPMAAEVMRTGEFTETGLPKGVYAALRAAYSGYRRLFKERARSLNLLRGLLDGFFPEFAQVFKDPAGKTALAVLSTCPAPTVIAGMTAEGFVDSVKAGMLILRLKLRKLWALHYAAQSSIGVQVGTQSLSTELALLA